MSCKSRDDGFSPLDSCSFPWNMRHSNVSCPREGQGWPHHWPWMSPQGLDTQECCHICSMGEIWTCVLSCLRVCSHWTRAQQRGGYPSITLHTLTHRRLPVPSHMGLRDASLDVCQDENPSKCNDLFLNTKEKKIFAPSN